ncbi:MAG: hypothetical protein DIZ80_01650 [endosymbiont of Galathealinum brachiosum]|uniref:Uncharacterized protein n=1 Tax=endosymbiont of Galathealinum brachiosum TaxID=2200906 RepID=A0A370DL79_9GAMM|nr:MAG: hypothetical protein DIZ80_01650 [endosymbiont of Galathealinum brachiosum]
MISIKALLISVTAMIFLGLTFELIFLFIDIGYNILMKSYPVTKSVRQPLYYLLIFSGLFIVMFTGGFLTSMYAKRYVIAHSVVAATIVCGIALYATSSGYDFTLLSVLFIIIGIAFTLYGNVVYKRNNEERSAEDIR